MTAVVLPCGATVEHRNDISDRTVILEMERDDYRLYDLPQIDTALDIGANFGAVSVSIATMFGATVHAYEPEPENFTLLVRNVDGNEHIVIHPEAIYDGRTTVRITPGRSGLTRVSSEGLGLLTVLATTLDDAVKRMGGWCDLCKCDTEGSEGPIFAAASEYTLRNIGRVYLEWHSPELGAEVAALLHSTHNVEVIPKPWDPEQGMLYAIRKGVAPC